MTKATDSKKEALDILNNFLNPDLLKSRLIIASMFIAVFENFKSWIIDNVKYFYFDGFKDGKETFGNYEKDVLSKIEVKKNRQIRATLLWLKENDAITDSDIERFRAFTNTRNELGHSLLNRLLDDFPDSIYDQYYEMVKMFKKVVKWWIREIELPTCLDPGVEDKLCSKDLADDEIFSPICAIIALATNVALNDNGSRLENLKKQSS